MCVNLQSVGLPWGWNSWSQNLAFQYATMAALHAVTWKWSSTACEVTMASNFGSLRLGVKADLHGSLKVLWARLCGKSTSTGPVRHGRSSGKKVACNPCQLKPTDEGSLPTLLLPDSSPEDLQAVPCATHTHRRQIWCDVGKNSWNSLCLSSGIIMLMQEVYGSESLPQRYFCLAAAKAAVPEAVLLVHDDSCHLYKYCLKRKEAGWP